LCFLEAFSEISNRMNIASAAAVYEKESGQYIFVGEVGEYGFLLVGITGRKSLPRDAA